MVKCNFLKNKLKTFEYIRTTKKKKIEKRKKKKEKAVSLKELLIAYILTNLCVH